MARSPLDHRSSELANPAGSSAKMDTLAKSDKYRQSLFELINFHRAQCEFKAHTARDRVSSSKSRLGRLGRVCARRTSWCEGSSVEVPQA